MLTIAVCDDDAVSVQSTCKAIGAFFAQKKLALSFSRFLSGEALLRDMLEQKTYFDAVFLDIGMEGTNGIETAKLLRKNGLGSALVFVTALPEYVFDAFEVEAANYLLKPLDEHKLQRTLEKIALAWQESERDFLLITKHRAATKVALADILYCEVLGHRVFVYEQGRQHEYPAKLAVLEQQLSQDFFRVHRSYIVNLRQVTGYREGQVLLPGGEKIPIATRRQGAFLKALLLLGREALR